ncbi:hypothetical protein DL766_006784 [Monosporascus sp. MC13-8B]|uniref:Uncharacterized protein n=1 Tax=Monosporascus cannonballus TaxID=155416 RepID=A0ABY0HBP1_9PEZI|nr:hypothetical protein DL762_003233 [Monosporascus cannonballus]RYP00814.1 hypothetical protein DL763_000539 [Monosporascus cannonballus]RYP26199.1 hypothetical protein DL766_006784 [Monosporascus sp. MC13-8B]
MTPQPGPEALAVTSRFLERPHRHDRLLHCGRQVYQLRSGSGTGISFRSLAIAIAASRTFSERVLVEIAGKLSRSVVAKRLRGADDGGSSGSEEPIHQPERVVSSAHERA